MLFQMARLHSFLCVKVAQSCLTLCHPMDYTVHGILQARTLEWVTFPFSRGSSQPRDPFFFFFLFLVPFLSTYQIQFYPSDIIKAKASWKLSLIPKGIFLIALTSTLWMVYQSICHNLLQLHVSFVFLLSWILNWLKAHIPGPKTLIVS